MVLEDGGLISFLDAVGERYALPCMFFYFINIKLGSLCLVPFQKKKTIT